MGTKLNGFKWNRSLTGVKITTNSSKWDDSKGFHEDARLIRTSSEAVRVCLYLYIRKSNVYSEQGSASVGF